MRFDKYLTGVILLTLLGAAARFYQLTFNSLWLDEISTYLFSSNSFSGIWQAMVNGEFNPPTFYWIEHIMMELLGPTDFALRLIPALAGIATIPAIYFLGKEVYDENAGIIAAFLFALAPWSIVYSQEGRVYSLVVLVATIRFYYFFRSLKVDYLKATWEDHKKEIKDMCIVGLLTALLFWLHFFTAVLSLFLILVYIYKKRWYTAFPLGITAILTLPLVIAIIPLIKPRLNLGVLFGVVGPEVPIQTIYQFGGFSIAFAVILVGLVAIGLYQLWKKNKMFSAIILGAILFVLGISTATSYYMIIVPRYLCSLLPLFFVAAACFYGFVRVEKKNFMVYAVLATVIMLLSPSLLSIYTVPIKPDFKDAAVYLYEHEQINDDIVFVPDFPLQFNFYYKPLTNNTVVSYVSKPEDLVTTHADYYVVSEIDSKYHKYGPQIDAWLENNTCIEKQFQFVTIRRPLSECNNAT